MIRQTFQHIPGVGPWREKDLWARGIRSWADFPAAGEGPGISRAKDEEARTLIARAEKALLERDVAGLASLLPAREHWRLYGDFADQAVFFDIETDGEPDQNPTVVSLFDSAGLHVFLQGRNMEELPAALATRPIWVTFNGSCFDVPVLRQHYPELVRPAAHIDLRFVCRRIGLHGGLKSIEDSLSLGRPPHLRGANGWDAVLLWRAHVRNQDLEALRFLVEYNLYDAFNLRTLLDVAYNRCVDELACDVPHVPVFDRGDILYDVSKVILALGPPERDPDVLARVRSQGGRDPERS